MLFHFLKSAWRHYRRQPLFTAINLFGLATAMAVCIMIMLYVVSEMSFDRFHSEAGNIYRLSLHMDIQGNAREEAVTSHAVGPDLVEHFPEVLNMTRISDWSTPVNIWQNENYITVEHGLYAENSFFEVFSFELLRGNPATALSAPYTVVLSEELAETLFPNSDPMGQSIRLDNHENRFLVTGILENCPPESHLQYNLLRSYPTLRETSSANFYEWDANINAFTYVLLAEGTDLDLLQEKTRALTWEKINYKFEGAGVHITLNYLPVTGIRLHSTFSHEMVESGTFSKVRIFSIVALFVLFVAGFNYVNLAIAHAGKRAREVGMRKVLGAHKSLLKRQFYTESMLLAAAGFLVALVLVETGTPVFNRIMHTHISLTGNAWWLYPLMASIFAGLFGFLAGVYPSSYMAKFQPVKILKGEFWRKPGKLKPGNLLLLVQFVVSLALIVSTLVIFLQIRHFNQTDLGFKAENLLVVQTQNMEDAQFLANNLAGQPWLTDYSISTGFPGGSLYMEGVQTDDATPGLMTQRFWVDRNFMKTMSLSLCEGRFFISGSDEEAQNVLINQTFANKAGWKEPLGQTISRGDARYRVIGVVCDFHVQSLHHEIEPLLINKLTVRSARAQQPLWIMIRFENAASTEVLATINNIWRDIFPDQTISHYFISDITDMLYGNEESFGKLFLSFTLLAIIIAMLGVLGLTAFAAQQRQKEVSIRKVLGASPASLLLRMSSEMLIWMLAAALIAFPLSWWYMERWLAAYPYAVDFPYWTMAASLATMLAIALLVVVSQSFSTTRKNPAEVLSAE